MSTPIRQNPAERLGTQQSRELLAQQEAARELNRTGLDAASDTPTSSKTGTARLNALVDQATQRTQSTPQSEQGRGTSTIGAVGAAPLSRSHAVDELGAHQQVFGTGETRLGPPTTPRVQITQQQITGAQSFANNLDHALSNVLGNAAAAHTRATDVTTGNGVATGGRLTSSGLKGLGPDELLSEFLKLQINDPNENVETHDKLSQLSSTLRQQALDDAKKQSANAQQMMKEAQAYAQQAQMIGTIVQVASIALTICTFGAGAVVGVAATAATTAATEAAVAAAQTAVASAEAAASAAVDTAVSAAVTTATEAGTTAATNIGTEAATQLVQNTTQQATQGFIQANQQVFQQAVQKTMEEAASKGVTLTTQQAETAVTQQIYNQLLPQVTQKLATQGVFTASSQAITQAGTQLASQAAAQSATTGVQGLVNRAGDVLTNMNQGVAGQMARATVVGGGIANGVAAGAQYKAAEKMADARQAGLEVTRSRFRAEQAQAQIEQENELINTIIESKNQTIDAVMQMTNATWASRQQLMAATMAR